MEIFDKVEYMEEKKSIKLLLNCLFFFLIPPSKLVNFSMIYLLGEELP